MVKQINYNEVKFYLKNKSKGKGTIFAVFNFGYKEDGSYKSFQLSTGEHIKVVYWDKENQCAFKNPNVDWRTINKNLNKIEIDIIEAYEALVMAKKEVTPE